MKRSERKTLLDILSRVQHLQSKTEALGCDFPTDLLTKATSLVIASAPLESLPKQIERLPLHSQLHKLKCRLKDLKRQCMQAVPQTNNCVRARSCDATPTRCSAPRSIKMLNSLRQELNQQQPPALQPEPYSCGGCLLL